MANDLHIPHLAVTVDKGNLQVDLARIVKELRPQWTTFETLKFTDGLTNDLHGVYEDRQTELILIRIFGQGTDMVIDRALEQRTMQLLHRNGCSQPIYATFENGICYGYQEGVVLEEEEMRSDFFSELIAKEVARLHTIPLPDDYAPGEKRSHLFKGFPGLLHMIPDKHEDPAKDERYQRLLVLIRDADLHKDIQILEEVSKSFGEPLVLCHHDLLNRNMIYSEKDKRIFLIDYEFAGLSYAPIDISGHFLSYIGLNNPDFKNFPSDEQQQRFLKIYLEEKNRLQNRKEEITDEEIGRWMLMVTKALLVNYLFWGLFCVLQETIIEIDFHFLKGAEMLIGAYHQYKDQLLAL